jgi:hypothetical protein
MGVAAGFVFFLLLVFDLPAAGVVASMLELAGKIWVTGLAPGTGTGVAAGGAGAMGWRLPFEPPLVWGAWVVFWRLLGRGVLPAGGEAALLMGVGATASSSESLEASESSAPASASSDASSSS